jgi:hypothetical protein
LVGGDHGVVSADRSLNHGDVDDIVVPCPPGEHADSSGLLLAHGLDVAQGQQPREVGLM